MVLLIDSRYKSVTTVEDMHHLWEIQVLVSYLFKEHFIQYIPRANQFIFIHEQAFLSCLTSIW